MQTIETLSKHLLLFVFLTLMGCSNPEGRLSVLLDEIEHQISFDAEGAQIRLDSLFVADSLLFTTPAIHARHILLDTYCKYRQNQEGKNDSLISVAEEYILQYGTIRQKMLCHLLHGVILGNASQYSAAMNYYQQVVVEGENTDEHFLLGQVYSIMTSLCFAVSDYDCLKYAQAALDHYSIVGDSLYIEDACANLGSALLKDRMYDSCYNYVSQNRIRNIQHSDSFLIQKSSRTLSEVELCLGMYDSAWVHMQQLRQYINGKYTYRDYGILAQLSAKIGRKEDAYHYLDSAQQFISLKREHLYNYLSQARVYHDLGDDVRAYHAYQESQAFKDSLEMSWSKRKVMVEQRDFVAQQLIETKMRQTITFYKMVSIIALLLMLITGLCYRAYRNKLTQKHLQEINRLLDEQVRQIELNKRQAIFCIKQTEPVQHFKSVLQGKGKVINQDWQELDKIFQEMLPLFREVLMEKSELSDIEWRICQLQKLEFSSSEIGVLVNRASNTVSSASARLCLKVLHREGGAREWSEFIHSI